MDYTAKDIFDKANNFDKATKVLNKELAQTNDIGTLIAPIITLSSFTMELYLKCIYMIETGKPASNIHELDKLFLKLSEESKNAIKKFYDFFVELDPSVKFMIKKVPEMKVELNSALKEMSGAFVKWRYSYEKQFTGFPTSGPLTEALKMTIKTLKPDWL